MWFEKIRFHRNRVEDDLLLRFEQSVSKLIGTIYTWRIDTSHNKRDKGIEYHI